MWVIFRNFLGQRPSNLLGVDSLSECPSRTERNINTDRVCINVSGINVSTIARVCQTLAIVDPMRLAVKVNLTEEG